MRNDTLYRWKRVNDVVFFEKQYMRKAALFSLFNKSDDDSELVVEGKKHLRDDGGVVETFTFLREKGFTNEEVGIIAKHLGYEPTVTFISTPIISLLKTLDNMRGIVFRNGKIRNNRR